MELGGLLKYSINENVVFAEVKDKTRVIFFDSDDMYILSGLVGSVVQLSPKNMSISDLKAEAEKKAPKGLELKESKFQEVVDALVKIKIFTVDE